MRYETKIAPVRVIDAESKIGRSEGRRQHPAEPGSSGRAGSGGVVEGDLPAGQALEVGDELSLAADGGEAVVPVGAEVGEAGARVGQQVPDDGCDTRSHMLRVDLADWRASMT
jgi:hypothetical protein